MPPDKLGFPLSKRDIDILKRIIRDFDPATTKGDISVFDGDDNQRLAVGSDNQVLIADAAETLGVKWATVPIAGGGTGQITKAPAFDALAPGTTQGDILFRGASNHERLGVGTAGQFLKTQGASANPVWADASSIKLAINTTEIDVTNSSTETTVVDETISGGTLSTNNALRLKVFFERIGTGDLRTIEIRVKFGTASLLIMSLGIDNDQTYGWLEFLVIADGAENAQKLAGNMVVQNIEVSSSDETIRRHQNFFAAATQDTSSDKDLQVSVKWTAINVNAHCIMSHYILEKIT